MSELNDYIQNYSDMTFNEYKNEAIKTAIYPQNYKIIYPTLGMCGECGEVADKIKKVIRDNQGIFDFLADNIAAGTGAFMETGDFERHLNRMRRIYKAKHDFFLKELKKRSWVRKIRGENAGLHLVVEVDCGYSEAELLELALERGVRVYGMSSYRIGERTAKEPVTLLLGFGGLSEEELSEGLAVLDELFSGGNRNG